MCLNWFSLNLKGDWGYKIKEKTEYKSSYGTFTYLNNKNGFHLFMKTNDFWQLFLRKILFTFSFFAIAKTSNNEYKFKIY